MPTYEARCPECGHTLDASCTIAAWRDMQPLVCECGTTMKPVITAPALATTRDTEGKA